MIGSTRSRVICRVKSIRLFGKKGAADNLREVRLRSFTGRHSRKRLREHLRSIDSIQSLLERNGMKMSREQLNCAMHLDAIVTLLLFSQLACFLFLEAVYVLYHSLNSSLACLVVAWRSPPHPSPLTYKNALVLSQTSFLLLARTSNAQPSKTLRDLRFPPIILRVA